jgi:enoyl-[acyl-carrier protein] reductase I
MSDLISFDYAIKYLLKHKGDYDIVEGFISALISSCGYKPIKIKALLESIARSFGYHYGLRNKVRVNTVSQSPTKTTAGTGIKGFGDFFDYADAIAPLGNATAEDCANYCVTLFSDLTKMVTMQNLFHDGCYSTTGVSDLIMQKAGITEG